MSPSPDDDRPPAASVSETRDPTTEAPIAAMTGTIASMTGTIASWRDRGRDHPADDPRKA